MGYVIWGRGMVCHRRYLRPGVPTYGKIGKILGTVHVHKKVNVFAKIDRGGYAIIKEK